MNDLAEWLLARIAEDEVDARAVIDADYASYNAEWSSPWSGGVDVGDDVFSAANDRNIACQIARWDPARVQVECEAKRGILALHATQEYEPYRTVNGEMYYPPEDKKYYCECQCPDGMILGFEPCETKQLLALPYADQHGYLEEWRP